LPKTYSRQDRGRGKQQREYLTQSPYLDRSLLPLALVLPRMLARIEVDLATVGPARAARLWERGEMIRWVLATSPGAREDHGRALD
jgi:hypothetical protein